MAQEKIPIVNRAITLLGNARIMSLADQQKAAKTMDAVYDGVRDSSLAVANWNFAIQLFNPAKSTEVPLFEYSTIYVVPEPCLRLIQIQDIYVGSPALGPRYDAESPKPPYRKYGKKIHTDETGTLNCRGVFRVTNEAEFDPLFIDYFITCLALAGVKDLTRWGPADIQILEGWQTKAMNIAVSRDAIEQPPEDLPDTSWIMSRVGP